MPPTLLATDMSHGCCVAVVVVVDLELALAPPFLPCVNPNQDGSLLEDDDEDVHVHNDAITFL